MGLSDALRRVATSRPHVMLVEGAGGAAQRLAVERMSREWGWPLVDTPADADILVVVGAVDALAQHVDRVWDQLPGPRAQVRAAPAEDMAVALEHARASLIDGAAQRADTRLTERPGPSMPPGVAMSGPAVSSEDPHAGHDTGGASGMSGHDMGGASGMSGHDMGGASGVSGEVTGGSGVSSEDPHAGHDMGGMGGMAGQGAGGSGVSSEDPHAGHDMGGHDMGGHDMGGHDMGGMEMGGMKMPAGLAMADRAPDRDGLKLDVLTVPWGPVLAWWPEGLVLMTVLQGDVVQETTVERLGDRGTRRAGWSAALAHVDPPVAAAVVRLDALVRLLGVAGWEPARVRCQRLRDALLAGERVGQELERFAGRVARSRSLARMTSGLRTSGDEDVTARYRRWLDEAAAAVSDGALPPAADEPHVLHALPALVTGREVAGMRLVVATLDLALSGADARAGAGV